MVVVKKPSKSKPSYAYFQTEMSLLNRIAETTKDFDMVAGYLALARHGDGQGKYGEPWRHTGAGAKKLNTLFNSKAKGLIIRDRLAELGYISRLPTDDRVSAHKENELTHSRLDICLPVSLVDSSGFQSAVDRIKHGGQGRGGIYCVPESEQLDTLMVLLTSYSPKYLDMSGSGGLNPQTAVYIAYDSVAINEPDGVRWRASVSSEYRMTAFARDCLSYRIPAKKKELTQADDGAFWKALKHIEKLGLVYKAVTLFNQPYTTNRVPQGHAVMTLEVLDPFANTPESAQEPKSVMRDKPPQRMTEAERKEQTDSIFSDKPFPYVRPQEAVMIPAKPGRQADPSYGRAIRDHLGTQGAFYEQNGSPSDRGNYEPGHGELRAVMPFWANAKSYSTVGVFRHRLRMASDPMYGSGDKWIDRETANIELWLAEVLG